MTIGSLTDTVMHQLQPADAHSAELTSLLQHSDEVTAVIQRLFQTKSQRTKTELHAIRSQVYTLETATGPGCLLAFLYNFYKPKRKPKEKPPTHQPELYSLDVAHSDPSIDFGRIQAATGNAKPLTELIAEYMTIRKAESMSSAEAAQRAVETTALQHLYYLQDSVRPNATFRLMYQAGNVGITTGLFRQAMVNKHGHEPASLRESIAYALSRPRSEDNLTLDVYGSPVLFDDIYFQRLHFRDNVWDSLELIRADESANQAESLVAMKT